MTWINILGGIAVLGSYVVGIATHPETSGAVWGGIPEGLQPVYTVSMFLAAGGYFLFTPYVYWQLDPEQVRVFGRYGYGAFLLIYAVILVPSALWMPLTFQMIDTPGAGLWLAIRLVLFAVGIASVALIAAVASANPAGSRTGRILAIVGAVAFAFQTAVLDAVVWPAFFPA